MPVTFLALKRAVLCNAQRLQLLPLELIGFALVRKKVLDVRVNSFCPLLRLTQGCHADRFAWYSSPWHLYTSNSAPRRESLLALWHQRPACSVNGRMRADDMLSRR